MSEKKLSRTTYRDPTIDPNNPPLRSGDTARSESAMDMDEYYRPLEQVHGSGAHGFGIATGLEVKAQAGAPGVHVLSGIALDSAGRHISLAGGGQAEVGINADADGVAPTLVPVDANNGALIPTAGLSGDKIVAAQFRETFDTAAWNTFGAYRYDHTPWLRLLPAAGFVDDGTHVALARVTIDGAGNVTSLVPGPRRNLRLPAQDVHLSRAVQAAGSPDFEVADAPYAAMDARAGGGLVLSVANPGDEIEMRRDGGGSFAKLAVQARQVAFKSTSGAETVRIDTKLGNVTAGGHGVEGDVVVLDANDRLAIVLDSDDALGVFGNQAVPGHVRVKGAGKGAPNRFEANGATGDVWFAGKLKDYANHHPGVSHVMLKDLTDGGQTSLHKHSLGHLGFWGTSGTRIGVVSGQIVLVARNEGPSMYGSVQIDFASRNMVPGGEGFDSQHSWVEGHQGSFAATPHVIMAPAALGLSTLDNTGYFSNYGANSSKVTFWWGIDTADIGFHQHWFYFLVIGPI